MTEISTPGSNPDPGRLDKVLGGVPRVLASHAHVVWLLVLGVYLIVLPLCGVSVPAKYELIGGNYTNVTSDIGACIAAGGTLTVLSQSRRRGKVTEATHKIVADLYRSHAGDPHPAEITEIAHPEE
ncbi:MAG: hypothetical protein JWM19_978 [Actinomycetia bacterium]|nr:hypothetical protein [Actinomycetes bacterium]